MTVQVGPTDRRCRPSSGDMSATASSPPAVLHLSERKGRT